MCYYRGSSWFEEKVFGFVVVFGRAAIERQIGGNMRRCCFLLFLVFLVLLFSSCSSSPSDDEIKKIIESYADAFENNNLNDLMNLFAKEITVVGRNGTVNHLTHLEARSVFSMVFDDNPRAKYDIMYLSIHRSKDIVSTEFKTYEEYINESYRLVSTDGYAKLSLKKEDGEWRIFKIELFDGESQNIAFNLKAIASSLENSAYINGLKNGRILGPEGKPVTIEELSRLIKEVDSISEYIAGYRIHGNEIEAFSAVRASRVVYEEHVRSFLQGVTIYDWKRIKNDPEWIIVSEDQDIDADYLLVYQFSFTMY